MPVDTKHMANPELPAEGVIGPGLRGGFFRTAVLSFAMSVVVWMAFAWTPPNT